MPVTTFLLKLVHKKDCNTCICWWKSRYWF